MCFAESDCFDENLLVGGMLHLMRKLSLYNYVDLHGNKLDGEFLDWIGEMSSLGTLDLSGNAFIGGYRSHGENFSH